MQPLAYYLTWSTYGTRLHGDQRGSVDHEHNQVGAAWLRPNVKRERAALASLRQAPLVLESPMRTVVAHAIRDHAAIRDWRLHALAVRSNHVHVIVDCRCAPSFPSPERVIQEFKSWGTRRLRRESQIDADRRVWTDHGSTRWINNDRSLVSAIDYVTRLQDGPKPSR
ncbi:MAG: transposase [Phycisphaerales bacterium]